MAVAGSHVPTAYASTVTALAPFGGPVRNAKDRGQWRANNAQVEGTSSKDASGSSESMSNAVTAVAQDGGNVVVEPAKCRFFALPVQQVACRSVRDVVRAVSCAAPHAMVRGRYRANGSDRCVISQLTIYGWRVRPG
jgi:hypothetical protein